MGEYYKSKTTSKSKPAFSGGRNNFNFKIPLMLVFALLLAGTALATHASTVDLQPEWSPAGQNVNYTVTFSNSAASPDAIGEVRIYNNDNYTDFICDAKTGWILSYPAPGICNYYAYPQSSNKILPGASADFTFSARTPEGGCEWIWQFETRDITFPTTGSINYLNDTTSVDDLGPEITKTLGNPQYSNDGDTWITQNTLITIDAVDRGELCGTSGLKYCEYKYTVDGYLVLDWTQIAPEQLPFIFNYEEDSLHVLDIRCYDKAGNEATHTQTEYVETQTPSTIKTLGDPKFLDGLIEWITTSTPITLTATDPDPHPSGVDKTWYLNVIDLSEDACWTPEEYCLPTTVPTPYAQGAECINEVQDYCEENWELEPYESWEACVEDYVHSECRVDPLWKLYRGPFTKAEESCHLLQFFSIDNLGQMENMQTNCFFVDDTPPLLRKEVGDPKVECEGKECDYYITKDTPITLTCTDQEPHPSDNVTIFWEYTVNDGEPIDGNYNGAEYVLRFPEESVHVLSAWCVDALGNRSETDTETFKVDSTPPTISKTMLGSYLGDCPPQTPDQNCFVADNGTSGVAISVTDPEPVHAVNQVQCEYTVEWKQQVVDEGRFTEDVNIYFTHDSTHTLTINCRDGLGNEIIDIENFLVDSTPPETAKTYGDPHYPANINDPAPYPHWITSQTPITLTATDAKVGVYKTYWRNIIISDVYCMTEYSGCQNYRSERLPGWNEYTGPFTKPEESCHLIDYYSVDLLGNTEDFKRQCVFVDNTVPSVSKTIGEPKVIKGEDTYITKDTNITLSCNDVLPHPVDNVSLKYRYRFNDDCEFEGDEGWTEWFDPAGPEVEKTFTFPEDSCHELEYYCEDALGNKTQTFSEIDIVDTVAPEIELGIDGSSIGECPGEDCYIDGVTHIDVTATDPQPHPVDDVNCEWSYVLDDIDQVFGPFTTFPIQFPEETTHYLTVTCKDALGNTNSVRDIFNVDKTPPITTKRYGQPFYTNQASDWITSSTPIYLSVEDAGPHKSGIANTYFNITLVDDLYCQDQATCQSAPGSDLEDFKEYVVYAAIPEQSCHLIEYYSVDNVGKTEEVKKQCVFVDNTPPNPVKTVGKPSSMWDGNDSIFYPEETAHCWDGTEESIDCWKVTTMTPITLGCQDTNQPHPVGKGVAHFKVGWDADDVTESYCTESQGQMIDGWCVVEGNSQLLFREETEHNLAYYCEDALGNVNPTIDEEKFKVEGTAFTIELNKKWNLISVPFSLINDEPEAVFADVAENIKSVWAYDAFTDTWQVYNPANPGASDLESIEPGNGYWLAALNPDTLVLGGSLFSPITTPPSKPIKHGWNLVGYYGTDGVETYDGPHEEGRPARCMLYSLGESVLDKGWTSLFTYWEPFNPNQWKPYDYYTQMDPGAGYWLSATEDGLYEYTTVCSGLLA